MIVKRNRRARSGLTNVNITITPLGRSSAPGPHLAVECKFVVWEKPVGLIKQKVTADKFLESPILALNEPVGTLALWKGRHRLYTHAHTHIHTQKDYSSSFPSTSLH